MGFWWAEGYLAERTEHRYMACSVSPIVDDQLLSPPDLAKETIKSNENDEKGKSSIVTLEPFSETENGKTIDKEENSRNNRKNQRQKWKLDPTLIHFNSLFGCSNWPRFLIFKTETDISAAKFENLLLSKCPSRDMTFRPKSRKEWLVEATTEVQSKIYQSLDNMDGLKVAVERHDKLNSIEGTVILPQNNDCDGLPKESLILDSLKIRYPNVEKVQVYEIPNKKNPAGKLRIAKIKFEGQFLPSDIKIEGQRRELLPFIPKPLQCKNCSKYGHTQNRCRNPSVCAFCASGNHTTTWHCGPPKCSNCGQDHHARSKVCPFYIYNTELKLLVSRSGMSIQEAKQELKSRGLTDPARNMTYRDAVKRLTSLIPVKIPEDNHSKDPDISNNNQEPSNESNNDIVTRNTYEILMEDDEDEISKAEPDLHEDHTELKTHKRNREETSPPKADGSASTSKKRILKLDRKTTPQKDQISNISISQKDQISNISPSPVFPSRFLKETEFLSPSPIFKSRFEGCTIGSKIEQDDCCECQDCIQTDAAPVSEFHHERCGCNACFIKDCKETKPLTKDKLRNIVRNFLSRKDTTSRNLELHPKDCMCISHLLYYRENRISVLDKFLETQKSVNEINSANSSVNSTKDSETSNAQTENPENPSNSSPSN